jgi:hypothetical protein
MRERLEKEMSWDSLQPKKMYFAPFLALSLMWAGALLMCGAVAAQEAPGPLPVPPPSETQAPPPVRAPESAPDRVTPQTGSHLDTAPPAIPVDQIIQKFAAREAEFKTERDNYTYTQTFVMQTIDPDGQPDGEYRMTSDIVFTPGGKRVEHRCAGSFAAAHYRVATGYRRPRACAALRADHAGIAKVRR